MELENVVSQLKELLVSRIETKTEGKLNWNQQRNLSYYREAGNGIAEFLNTALTNDKMIESIANKVAKDIINKAKEENKREKIIDAKNAKLWKITNGKIPCLNECGYHDIRSKSDVLNGSNSFICAKCSIELKETSKDAFMIFNTKNIYKLCNIE